MIEEEEPIREIGLGLGRERHALQSSNDPCLIGPHLTYTTARHAIPPTL
jgi:hypothetical protein